MRVSLLLTLQLSVIVRSEFSSLFCCEDVLCITNLLTTWNRVLFEKLTGPRLVKKLLIFYGTRRFITTFTSACRLSLTWAISIQSISPHPTSWRSILILSSHLRLGLQCGFLPSGFTTKTMHLFSIPYVATCPAHLILLWLITRIIFSEEFKLLRSSLCSFLHSPFILSLLDPNILFSTLLSDNPSLRYSLNVSDQVSHPNKTTSKIIVLYILIFKFSVSKLEDKRLCIEWEQAFPDFSLFLISSWIDFWFIRFVHKHLNCSTLPEELL